MTRHAKNVTFLDLKTKSEQYGYFFSVLIVLSYFLVVVTFPLSLCFCIKVRSTKFRIHLLISFIPSFKVVQEYERAVIFRLGRILANGARGKSKMSCKLSFK